ncbi:MAG: ATP-binding protein [Clostridia bacterium]|nr:ATP-binding protein [Clostridia bacterium]MBQ6123535.1 ATP-binding protein [Clostridia bacterium]
MLKISGGKVPRAQKVAVYGSEGIGKTTFAAMFPSPLFIDTEGGTAHMDVRRIDDIDTWEDLIAAVEEVAAMPDICKTLVLDTMDWAERLAVDKVCRDYKLKSIEAANYGKGYVYLSDTVGELLTALDTVIASGKHVVVTAHAKMRKFEQPDEQGAFDRWEMKLSKQVAPLVKEWCDMLLFLNYKTYVVTTETNSKKAQGGKRVMYTTHHPCWDAKNRHGLPDELPLDYAAIAHIFEGVTPTKPVDQLRKLLADSGITEDELMKVVSDKGHYAADVSIDSYEDKFISGWCIKHFDQIKNVILAGRESLPENKEG